ncbi:MAG: hypothetical protein Q4B75_04705 [Eubacteriales bacterium]|nr:hypothetical protein [Eubacteriales bacterium]
MIVLDILSWLPAKEMSLEQLEHIFEEYYTGTYKGEYIIPHFSLVNNSNFPHQEGAKSIWVWEVLVIYC